jgi:hypothetical protein
MKIKILLLLVMATLKHKTIHMQEADLTLPGKQFGNPALNEEQSILFMYDHIINHRAKTVLYLRLNKINPSAYRFN